jgi:hypothetical protein
MPFEIASPWPNLEQVAAGRNFDFSHRAGVQARLKHGEKYSAFPGQPRAKSEVSFRF